MGRQERGGGISCTCDVALEKVAPSGALLVQLQDRRQQNLVLLRANVKDGSIQVILRETRPKSWVNLHFMLVPLPSSDSKTLHFLLASEREEDFMHLFVSRSCRNRKDVMEASHVWKMGC